MGLQCPRWMPSLLELLENRLTPPHWCGVKHMCENISFLIFGFLLLGFEYGVWFQIHSVFISPEVFLRCTYPNLIEYYFLKQLTQPISAQLLAGLAKPRGGDSGGVSQNCLKKLYFWAAATSALSLTEKQNRNESEHEPKWRCSWYWWKRQARGLWQGIRDVSCVFLWCLFGTSHCGSASSLFKHSQQHFFPCSYDSFQMLTLDTTSMWAFGNL